MDGTHVMDEIATKAKSTDTFVKEVSGTDIILPLGNKFRIVTGADSVFRLQRFDDDGTLVTDGWLDVYTASFNTNTNESSLFARGVDIVSVLNGKAPASTPTFTGTATFVNNVTAGPFTTLNNATGIFSNNLTLTGSLSVGGTDVMSVLGSVISSTTPSLTDVTLTNTTFAGTVTNLTKKQMSV